MNHEEVRLAAVVLRNALLNDDKLHDAFVDSIVSALRDAPAEPGQRRLAEYIACRLVGGEE